MHRINNYILCRHIQTIRTYEKSMQILLQQVKRTLARQYVIFMNTTPMCQNLDSSPIPKQGGSDIHAVQKLGYTVLNMAPHRLIQEEVTLMHLREKVGESCVPAVLKEGMEMKLCIIFRRKLCLCISVIIKQFRTD